MTRPRLVHFEIGEERFAVLSFPRGAPPEDAGLTHAEMEVTLAMLAGRSNAEIAQARNTSPRTVANQVASIFRKLGVQSRSDLVARCRNIGVLLTGS